ncbi:MAG TPA: GNAT family N-acetyltransferase [Steroidobacteraceae bacterium]|nr:GNAT family N-acetyltransferase [Steroidobacteraceae bacterium]
MCATLPVRKIGPQFAIRIGAADEIDTLRDIDDDASRLFVEAGLDVDVPPDHEFIVRERSRWLHALQTGNTLLIVGSAGAALGFAATGTRDGEPYLDQLSVRTHFMRIGLGSALLEATENRARANGARTLWLTTYRHLPWNRPFYERAGFVVIPEADCGTEMLATLMYERRWLPQPGERVVMRKDLDALKRR